VLQYVVVSLHLFTQYPPDVLHRMDSGQHAPAQQVRGKMQVSEQTPFTHSLQ
jgi:hypothetical protein